MLARKPRMLVVIVLGKQMARSVWAMLARKKISEFLRLQRSERALDDAA